MTDSTEQFVYFFGDGQAEGGSNLKHLVSGKGASLADMTWKHQGGTPGCHAHSFGWA